MRILLATLTVFTAWTALLAQPYPQIFDAPLITVVEGSTGRVVQPGDTDRIAVRVEERGGAPLADQAVQFVVRVDRGAFLGAASDERVFDARTGGNGVAEAQLVVSAEEGPFLVAARVLETNAEATVAYTVLAQSPETPISAEAASDALRSGLLSGAVEDENLRVHGPFLLTARDQVHPFGGAEPSALSVPHAVNRPHWFFWIDDVPVAAFSHPVRYASLDAAGDPSSIVISPANWWPYVVRGAGDVQYSLASPQPPLNLNLEALTEEQSPPFAPEDACAIIIAGPELWGLNHDVMRIRSYFVDMDLVAPRRVLYHRNIRGNFITSARTDVQALFDFAKASGCKKYYIVLLAHGAEPRNGRPGALLDDGPLQYDQFVEMLKGLDADRICLVVSSCYSGEIHSWLQGHGLQGSVLTSADDEHTSWMNYRGSKWLQELFEAAEDTEDLDEAQEQVVSTSDDELVTSPMPTSRAIATGPRKIHASHVRIPAPGKSKRQFLRRPAGVDSNATMTVTFQIIDEGIATTRQTLEIEPGDHYAIPRFDGVKCGETRYEVRAVDQSTRLEYVGEGVIQVGAFMVNPDPLVIVLQEGQISRGEVTITRFGNELYLLDDNSTSIRMVSRDESVAVPGLLVPSPVAHDQTEITLGVLARGAGETQFEVHDELTGSVKVFTVRVIAAQAPAEPVCPSSGTAFVNPLPVNGTPQPGDPTRAAIRWNAVGNRMSWSSNLNTLGPAFGDFDRETCSFSNVRVEGDGFTSTFNGRFELGDPIRFQAALSYDVTAPVSRSVQYRIDAVINDTGGMILSPESLFIHSDGGEGSVGVGVPPGTPWSAASVSSWITLTGAAAGQGPGLVSFTVDPHSGSRSRTGFIDFGPLLFTVEQLGFNPLEPRISDGGVVTASGAPGASGWISVYGQELATETRVWGDGDFQNGMLPTRLGDFAAFVGGAPAAPSFISPNQANILPWEIPAEGDVDVIIFTPFGFSKPAKVFRRRFAPDLFRFSDNNAAAVAADGGLIGPAGLFAQLNAPALLPEAMLQGGGSRPALPGERVLLFGSGWGPTDPPTPASELVAAPSPLAHQPVVLLGGEPVQVEFAGKIAPGLIQFNIVTPDLPAGRYAIDAYVNGFQLQSPAFLEVGP